MSFCFAYKRQIQGSVPDFFLINYQNMRFYDQQRLMIQAPKVIYGD